MVINSKVRGKPQENSVNNEFRETYCRARLRLRSRIETLAWRLITLTLMRRARLRLRSRIETSFGSSIRTTFLVGRGFGCARGLKP
jgi:hypothetical protein